MHLRTAMTAKAEDMVTSVRSLYEPSQTTCTLAKMFLHNYVILYFGFPWITINVNKSP